MSEELKVLTTVASEAEAELVCERLAQAGIQALPQRTIGGPEWGTSGSRNVYVTEADLERGRVALAADEGEFSDEELTRLSEQAAREARESR
jgi:hypothetical protein